MSDNDDATGEVRPPPLHRPAGLPTEDEHLLPNEWHGLADLVAEGIPAPLARLLLGREGAPAIRRELILGNLAALVWEQGGPASLGDAGGPA